VDKDTCHLGERAGGRTWSDTWISAMLTGAALTARADMPSPEFLLFVILAFPAPSVTESQRTPARKPEVFP